MRRLTAAAGSWRRHWGRRGDPPRSTTPGSPRGSAARRRTASSTGARRRGGRELRAGARRDPASVVADALAERDRRREFDASRLDMIRAYAETLDCRRRVVLELLGEDYPERCGHCDNCEAGTSEEAA